MIRLSSRRYIGSKAKIAHWIIGNLMNHLRGGSFCDLFAGTGIVSEAAIPYYGSIVINDILFSNNIIHKAFFGEGYFDRNKIISLIDTYNKIDPNTLPDNYFSINFGDKYFDVNNAKKIGFIREDVEYNNTLTSREYHILLTSLIYGMDRIANTVGHFDAYIKKPIRPKILTLYFPKINPHGHVTIIREDANKLADRIQSDIVYIDPPYNSRQYSRFYHIYENLVKWEKPSLYGIALKPKPENMSLYCTNKAKSSFKELIQKLDAKYIAVSYNNTYNSKSSSSKNRINLTDLTAILMDKGNLYIYDVPYAPFNAGKTNFIDHKEYLFIVKNKI